MRNPPFFLGISEVDTGRGVFINIDAIRCIRECKNGNTLICLTNQEMIETGKQFDHVIADIWQAIENQS